MRVIEEILWERKEGTMLRTAGRALQADGTASARAQRQEGSRHRRRSSGPELNECRKEPWSERLRQEGI